MTVVTGDTGLKSVDGSVDGSVSGAFDDTTAGVEGGDVSCGRLAVKGVAVVLSLSSGVKSELVVSDCVFSSALHGV